MKTEDIKMSPRWNKSKEEIWKETFSGLEGASLSRPMQPLSWAKYAAAAVIALFITVSAFAYLYETTTLAARGTHPVVTLPDGSKVHLNADSRISYKPYWWLVSRRVALKGEAFFEAVPGSRFTVTSFPYEVNVLGTSFNIFARSENYRVTCVTGQVEVVSGKAHIRLTPNMQAYVHQGELHVSEDIDALLSIGWIEDTFSFMGVPLTEVVAEIERQYDIRVSTASRLDHLYTGYFSKKKKPEEVLEIIGKPFGITFNIEP